MDQFFTFFQLGLEHILDENGLDHILFVIALAAVYTIEDWKRVIWLVTAFTLGHSITLVLSVLDYLDLDPQLVETLIPITILITALSNILINRKKKGKSFNLNYLYAIFFGLIHGLGFSIYFKSLFGKSNAIIQQLFAFNIGLEVGQLVIICLFLSIGFLILNILKFNRRAWIIFVSAIVAIKALHIIITNIG